MGEDIAAHGDWTVGTDGEYVTDIDLASVQAYRLFVPPPPPPPPPRMRPVGYPPVRPAVAPGMKVRLLVELREDGSDSDGDMSMLGIAERPLVYWPTDWKTATLIDLADGRVYSKEEVDALIAQEAQARAAADDTERNARVAADNELDGRLDVIEGKEASWDAKYDKPSGGIPKSDMASSVQASLDKADTALQAHQDISGKADKAETYTKSEVNSLVASTGGKFIVVQTLPSAASADPKAIYLVPRTTSETGNIYDEFVRVEPTAGTYAWEKLGSTEIDLSAYRTAAAQDLIDAGKADAQHSHARINSTNDIVSVVANNDGSATIEIKQDILTATVDFSSGGFYKFYFADSLADISSGISAGIRFMILRNTTLGPQSNGYYDCSAAFVGIDDGVAKYGPVLGYVPSWSS
jgi:hypothetical protein